MIEEEFSGVCAEKDDAVWSEELKGLRDESRIVELDVEHLIHFLGSGNGRRIDDDQVVFFLRGNFLA